jgi:hypothetical protein
MLLAIVCDCSGRGVVQMHVQNSMCAEYHNVQWWNTL